MNLAYGLPYAAARQKILLRGRCEHKMVMEVWILYKMDVVEIGFGKEKYLPHMTWGLLQPNIGFCTTYMASALDMLLGHDGGGETGKVDAFDQTQQDGYCVRLGSACDISFLLHFGLWITCVLHINLAIGTHR